MPLDADKAVVWYQYSRWLNVFVVLGVATCWALIDAARADLNFLPAVLWTVLVVGVFALYLAVYLVDRKLLDKRWTFLQLIRQAFWRTVFPTVSLLFVAVAFEAFYARRLSGVLWLIIAGVVAVLGGYRLRVAEGMTLRKVKSGEVHKRALFLAKETGTTIKRVYIVPAGPGNLANAYGLTQSIAITDNYGKFLRGSELDSVIGHELGHVRGRHGRKRLKTAIAMYGFLAVLAFVFPPSLVKVRPFFDTAVVILPVLALNFVTRKFEYEADRAAADLVGPDVAVDALNRMYEISQVPADCNLITELFMTHPSLKHRVQALRNYDKSALAAASG